MSERASDPSGPTLPGEPRGFNLPRWSLGAPAFIVLGTVFFLVWGTYSYLTMSRREDPEIRIAMALVITIYPGAGAQKVEEHVTRKLEDAIESMDNLKSIESTSRANLSVIFVSMRYEADLDLEWQKLRSRLQEAAPDLPEGIIGPKVMDNFGDTTGMIVSLTGAHPDVLAELAQALRSELRPIQSVGDMEVLGKQENVVYLEGRRADLARYNLTPYQVAQAVKMHNLRIPAGSIRTDRYQFRVEPTGAYDSAAAIGSTVVDVNPTNGLLVHVRDLFTVRRSTKTPADTMLLENGQTAVALGIVMKQGFNIVEMGADVRAALASFQTRLPQGVKLTVVHDSPRQVSRLVNDFMLNLVEGIIIVVLAMALLMGLRSATISAVAIPLSVLIALCLMPSMRIDLEMVSIASFIVALGMLVDNSIIVADNIDIKLRQGMSAFEAAWRGTSELTAPVVVGTLATVVAFLPMLLLTDETGAYIRGLPLVVSVSLLGSLLVALTITPLMARYLMRQSPTLDAGSVETRYASRVYTAILRGTLRMRWLVVLLTLGSLAVAAYMFVAIGFSFFPDAQRDQFTVDIWLKEGSSAVETERVARLAEQKLHEDKEVGSTLVHVGKGGPRFYITVKPEFQTSNYAQIMVNTASEDSTASVIDRFNAHARDAYPGARVFARKLVMGMPIDAPIEVRVIGQDIAVLRRLADQVQDILRQIPGTSEVRDNVGADVPSLKVKVDPERSMRVGITNTDVALAFLASYEGFELTQFADGEDEIPVIMRLVDEERTIEDDVGSLPVASNVTNKKVPLRSIATVDPDFGPGVVRRYDNQRAIVVQAWTRGRLANDVLLEAWPRINGLSLPPGYRLALAGEKKEMDKVFGELLIVFGVILLGLIGLLMLQLKTARRTLLVLLSVPLSVIGAAGGLYYGGYSFSFTAFLGVISLAGMALKNSVVWIEFVEQARAAGMPMAEAIVKAGIYRLRPIFLTTATTVGGLVPLALFGGVLFEPMAWAIIAGLSVVTALTLLVMPVLYTLIMPNDLQASPTPQ
ncbi:MAG: efflux RND transporter permease subunit [Myxococcota bacterium]|jgi:multidrug efflux pump subunit AcrB|nr:efflux RND transporter permease subunit [Myxococcota bacterium]